MTHDEKITTIRKANLNYQGASVRSEDGLPVGNGTMGTMVWTSPASIKLCINRVDVFANGNATNSFPEPHTDYGYACGFVDIDLAGCGDDAFGVETKETLDVYDAAFSLRSGGIMADGFLAAKKDIMNLRLSDGRENPEPVEVRLRMLRDSVIRTRNHLAVSTLQMVDGTAVLKQEFTEDDFYCASAVAVRVTGRSSRARLDTENGGVKPLGASFLGTAIGRESETEIRLRLPAEQGNFEVWISSAQSMDRAYDPADEAVESLRDASEAARERLYRDHLRWWHDFWDASFLSITGSEDAEEAGLHYNYFLYIMAICSRNAAYAPNFGGLNLSTRGDGRAWGTMQWWNNLSLYYNALLAAGHPELMTPYLNMYFNMMDTSRIAARQVWGAEGIYIGETTYAWGPEVLPDDIAEELRALMLLRKPWAERSERFMRYAKNKNSFEPRWNWLIGKDTRVHWDRGELVYAPTESGPFAHVSHIFGSMANLAYHFWLTWQYTGNRDFLERKAYPMIREVAEFFRTYPHTVREADGQYHILYTNHEEEFRGAKDTLDTMNAAHGILRTAIAAAEVLGVDLESREKWREMLEHLAPLPTSRDTACDVERPMDGSEIFVGSRGKPVCREEAVCKPHPCLYFDMCTLQTQAENPELYEIGRNTVRFFKEHYERGDMGFAWEMSQYPRIFANMGEGDILCDNILHILRDDQGWGGRPSGVFRNRLTSGEGPNAIGAERLGNVAAGIQLGLLQSSGGGPAKPGVIRVFPAWKKTWDAEYELYARDGLKVRARHSGGIIRYVEIEALWDTTLRFVNPWERCAEDAGTVYTEHMIQKTMKAGERVRFVPAE